VINSIVGKNRANLLPRGAASTPLSYLRCQNGWQPIGIDYRGWPIYVRLFDGTMAYEADGMHLVSLPEAVEDAICDLLELDYLIGSLSPEAIDALKQRAN
jgi:hypothetical protein